MVVVVVVVSYALKSQDQSGQYIRPVPEKVGNAASCWYFKQNTWNSWLTTAQAVVHHSPVKRFGQVTNGLDELLSFVKLLWNCL